MAVPFLREDGKCSAHPNYQEMKKPTTGCEVCWALYLGLSETCINCGCQCIDEKDDPDGD